EENYSLSNKSAEYSCDDFVSFKGNEWDPELSILENYTFNKGLEFVGCTFKHGLFFNKLTVRGGLKIVNCTNPEIEFKKKSIRASLHLREINIDQITLENVNFYHGVYFESAPSNKS